MSANEAGRALMKNHLILIQRRRIEQFQKREGPRRMIAAFQSRK